MTRHISLAIAVLSLCSFVACSGCKSSRSLGLAENAPAGALSGNPSGAEQIAAATPASEPVSSEDTATLEKSTVGSDQSLAASLGSAATSGVTDAFKKATTWLPFRREAEIGKEESNRSPQQMLERELTFRSLPTVGTASPSNSHQSDLSLGNAVKPLSGTLPDSDRDGSKATPATPSKSTSGTPSLVRRSRRPPPDPAPKPPQTDAIAKSDGKPTDQMDADATERKSVGTGQLAKTIASASRAWQTDMKKADSAQVAKTSSATSELKFSPPVKTTQKPSSVAKTVAAPKPASEKQKPEKQKPEQLVKRSSEDGDTIPSRAILAQQKSTVNPNAGASLSKAKTTEPSSQTASTTWVAKKSGSDDHVASQVAVKKMAAESAVNEKSVIAETLAQSAFVPRATVPAAQIAAARESELALPTRQTSPVTPPADPRFVSNPHMNQDSAVSTPMGGFVASPPTVSSHTTVARSTNATHVYPHVNPASPTASANPAMSGTQWGQPAVQASTSKAWQPPLPFAPSGSKSYQPFYQQGLMPVPSATHPVVPHLVQAQQQPELAPVIDASAYRQRAQQGSYEGAKIPVVAGRNAAQGTWLAAYQKLVGSLSGGQSKPEANGTVTHRVSSDQ